MTISAGKGIARPAGRARSWVMAARPATLPAAVVPVLVGSGCALGVGGFRLGPALAALGGSLLIQIGTNLANDVFDYERGADRPGRTGPTRVTQAGLLSPRAVRAGMWTAFGLATACGLYLVTAAGWPVVVIGLASIAAGIAYTAGPYPLGYHGLGDLFVMIFFGFVGVCGTAFVEAGRVPPAAWPAAAAVGALTTAILVVNNLRDREADARSGKRTLAVRLGRRGALAEYAVVLAAGYAAPVVLVAARLATGWALLPLATLPLAIGLFRTVATLPEGPALNRSLKQTAGLLLLHGALLAVGLSQRLAIWA